MEPSSPSPAAAGNREPPSDDDVSMSVTHALGKEARVLFQLGKYADCLKVLQQLIEKKPDDPKILHNIAIAENFQDGFSNPRRLVEVLNDLKKRSGSITGTPDEHVDAANNIGSKAMVGNKGLNSGANQLTTSSLPLIYLEEYNASLIMFNIAVTWYHLHEYEKCFSVLDPLYQSIQPVDERVARHICLLLLDVSLVCRHLSRAADVITYLETVSSDNLVSQGDGGNLSQQQSANPVTKSTSDLSSAVISDSSSFDSTPNPNGPESPITRTLSEEKLDDLISTLETSGDNRTRFPNGLPMLQVDESVVTPDLRIKLHLYKVWLLLLTRNFKASKREVKMVMNEARGRDYTLALYLKSQLEYARGNHRKAIKVLMASSSQTDTYSTSSMYYNNLGCIFYQLGKYHTSTVFFSKALNSSSSLSKEKPLKLLSFSQDKSLLIVYNCGLVYLACGKPVLAARCFHKAGLIFYNQPLLWLRMAECCLMSLEKKSEIKVHVIGKGKWRRLAVDDRGLRNGQVECVGKGNFSDDGQQPNLSLSFAQNCLFNALHLLNRSGSKPQFSSDPAAGENESAETASTKSKAGPSQSSLNGEVKEQKGGNSGGTSLHSSISEYEVFCGKHNHVIKQAVLADLAYVQLELGNPVKALSTARSLLELPECLKIYVFLGNLYAAEALCLLNRPKEAAEHLAAYVSGENNVELPYSQEDCELWQTEKAVDVEELPAGNASLQSELQRAVFLKPEEARGMLLGDLAAVSAIKGDTERAQELVALAISAVPNSPEVFLTAIYIDLVRGHTQEAITKLKECSRVRFLPGTSTSTQSSC